MAPRPDSISLGSLSRGSRHSYIAVSPIQDEISENDEDGTEPIRNPAEGDQETQKTTLPALPSARLHRSGYIPFIVFLYIGLAVFAWVVTCYLSFRPITTNHYDLQALDNSNWAPPDIALDFISNLTLDSIRVPSMTKLPKMNSSPDVTRLMVLCMSTIRTSLPTPTVSSIPGVFRRVCLGT